MYTVHMFILLNDHRSVMGGENPSAGARDVTGGIPALLLLKLLRFIKKPQKFRTQLNLLHFFLGLI